MGFDSYPAILFAYAVVSGPEPDEETEENKIEDEDKENENKNQLLFFKDFKSFLKVLKEYYFLCMTFENLELEEGFEITREQFCNEVIQSKLQYNFNFSE